MAARTFMNPAMEAHLAQAPQAPEPPGDGQSDSRISEQEAGYMELEGAQKDADCETVSVQGGVSSQLGCCNLFDPQQGAPAFTCGTCNHIENSEDQEQPEPQEGQS